jgi:hypothetical protein
MPEMRDVEKRLAEIGELLELPAAPPLAGRVGDELRNGERRAGVERDGGERPTGRRSRPAARRRPTLRVALLTALAVLLLAAAAAAAVPDARHAILDLLGLRAETIERVPKLPENARAKPSWGLGHPTTLAAARHQLAFDPLLPRSVGAPTGVFIDAEIPGGALTLTYPPQPDLPRSRLTGVGLLVNQLSGHFAPGFYGKLVPRDATVTRFAVGGRFAVWIEGLHLFFYKPTANHTFYYERGRLAANALLVQHGDVMVRLEGKFDKATAVSIARSLRR